MRVGLGSVLVMLILLGCSEELSVEQQIIATLRSMEYAAEEGELFEFLGYVADSFSGQQGSMDRREFHRFMIFQVNEHRRLQAQFFPIRVKEVDNNQAQANFNLLVTGGGGLLPESGRVFEVETHWRRVSDDWLLEKADWVPARLPDIQPGRN